MFFRIICLMFFKWIFRNFLGSFLGPVKICSNIVLQVADLCKCTRRRHGNMSFWGLAPCILMNISWFRGYFLSHVNFRFVLGSILEAILVRFGICFRSFGWSKSEQISSKNDAKIDIDKSSEMLARRAVRGRSTSPLGAGDSEERKKKRKAEGKEGRKEDLKI